MKKNILAALLIFYLQPKSGVTYIDNGARLGDRLVCYLHAKWISYKYNIPLYFVTFPYADQLRLFSKEKFHISYSDINKLAREFGSKQEFGSGQEFKLLDNCLHIIPYFPESLEEHRPRKTNHPYKAPNPRGFPTTYFKVNWDEPGFKSLVKNIVSPKNFINLIEPPKGYYAIALHVRKGRGFDIPLLSETPRNKIRFDVLYHDVGAPWKVPPDEYYINELKRVLKNKDDERIYIYLFSDDPQIKSLVDKYRNAIKDPRVVWDYRESGNNHDMNVLEDLFSIAHNFDCLIRGDSNFSIISDIIGDHELVISPADHDFINGYLSITKVNIKLRKLNRTLISILDSNKL